MVKTSGICIRFLGGQTNIEEVGFDLLSGQVWFGQRNVSPGGPPVMTTVACSTRDALTHQVLELMEFMRNADARVFDMECLDFMEDMHDLSEVDGTYGSAVGRRLWILHEAFPYIPGLVAYP